MPKQNLKNTHAMYDHFEKLALFVRDTATDDEVHALIEVMRPLVNAVEEKSKTLGPASWQN